jgi:hypothetical protein
MYSKYTQKPAKPTQTLKHTGGVSQKQYGGTDEEYFEYKARKYHYKCQQKLKELMQNGGRCPAGYEKYLKPYA